MLLATPAEGYAGACAAVRDNDLREAIAGIRAPTLVIAGSGPYEEDDWTVIRIGPVVFDVAKPCTRCVLTTVDPATGQPAADQEPLATLMRTRQFDDGVRFGQNLAARNEGLLEVGMEVEVLETTLAF
mgnify:CR=1 FL=1